MPINGTKRLICAEIELFMNFFCNFACNARGFDKLCMSV